MTDETGAQFAHEVVAVGNPHGEVYHNDKHKPHMAVRRVGRTGGWATSRTIGGSEREALEWYTERLAVWRKGLVRCGLAGADSAGGGGGGGIARTEAQIIAGDHVNWARGFIPIISHVLFDAIVEWEMSFTEAGARFWPMLSSDRSARVAQSQFSAIAKQLAEGLRKNGVIQ